MAKSRSILASRTKGQLIHLGLAVFWVCMAVPTMTIWSQSILLVLMMSLFANIESSLAAYLSATPKPKRKQINTTNLTHKGGMLR